jgi:hypothetical protein
LEKLLESTFGPPTIVQMGSAVGEMDCERGLIYTADGAVIEKDLLILANGASVGNGSSKSEEVHFAD